MNRRKKLIRYDRLHTSQWIRFIHKDRDNPFLVRTVRVLIALRNRVVPWRVIPIRGYRDNRITAFEII